MHKSYDNDLAEEAATEDYANVHAYYKRIQLPSLVLDNECSKPLESSSFSYTDLDYYSLVEMWTQHQTHHAACGTHTKGHSDSSENVESTQELKPETLHCQLIHQFHKVLREEQEDHAVEKGLSQEARWKSVKGGQTKEDVDDEAAGNV